MKIVKEKNNEIKELKKETSIENLIETNNNIFKRIEELSKNLDINLKDYTSFSKEEKEVLKASYSELINIIKAIESTQNNFSENLLKKKEREEEILTILKKILFKNDMKPSRVSKYVVRR